jgi:hypothetical protein
MSDDDNEAAKIAVALLMENGYFTDDDGCYASTSIEREIERVEAEVRMYGYCGGPLESQGRKRRNKTAVYIAYDSDKIDYDEAGKILKRLKP